MNGLVRPTSALAWDLRGAMAAGKSVRLVLSDRCDAVIPNDDGDRIIEGLVRGVSATDAYTVVDVAKRRSLHVPLDEIVALHKVERQTGMYAQAEPSQNVYDLPQPPVESSVRTP